MSIILLLVGVGVYVVCVVIALALCGAASYGDECMTVDNHADRSASMCALCSLRSTSNQV